ncbi:hypothetical protein [Rhodoplanes azumiensis]|uniref:DUF1376 domain-containing protein n=1 Tax=Rhodoplanes azumiensis TaxID=1897628 RepID=A0ABW5AKE6_9BRAD
MTKQTTVRQPSKRRRFSSNETTGVSALRVPEIERVFRHRYVAVLPDDDAGRDDLDVLLVHVLRFSNGHQVAPSFVRRWAPWASAEEAATLVEKAAGTDSIGTADEVAERLGLTYEERQKLGITTIGAIDCGPAERARRRKERHAARQRARRRERKQDAAERRGKVLARLDLSPRAASLFDRLASGRWMKLPEVERSWTEGEVGGLSPAAKHMAVWRAARELVRVGLVDIRTGKIGQPAEVRRVADTELTAANTACYRNKAPNAAKSSDPATEVGSVETGVNTGTYSYNADSVRTAPDAYNEEGVRTARDAACAAYSYNYGSHAGRWWASPPYSVTLSLDETNTIAVGAPEGAPAQHEVKDEETDTFEDVQLAEPEPNPSILELVLPRAPEGARAGTRHIVLNPDGSEFTDAREPRFREEPAAQPKNINPDTGRPWTFDDMRRKVSEKYAARQKL